MCGHSEIGCRIFNDTFDELLCQEPSGTGLKMHNLADVVTGVESIGHTPHTFQVHLLVFLLRSVALKIGPILVNYALIYAIIANSSSIY